MKKVRKGRLPDTHLILAALGECGVATNFIPKGMSAYKAYHYANHEEYLLWFLAKLNLDLTINSKDFAAFRRTSYWNAGNIVYKFPANYFVWRDKLICNYIRRHVPWRKVKEALLTDYRIEDLIKNINSGQWSYESLLSHYESVNPL